MNLLEIKGLKIQYKTDDYTVKAVNGIDLTIEKGKTLGLVGETGAGKTTTALGILNLIQNPPGEIVEGEIIFNGRDILKEKPVDMRHIRGKDISMIFQDPMTALNPIMRIGNQVMEVISQHEKCTKAEAMKKSLQILEAVGIHAERSHDYPNQFSGGMKQRVVIAMALACNPQLLIADEPTTALDVTIQAQILEMMIDMKQKLGTSMLLITHDLGIIAEICDDVAIMYAGEIIESGTLEHIFRNASHPYTLGLFGSLPSLVKKVKRLNPIPGLMPDPTALPAGCKFYERCEKACDKCAAAAPQLTELEPGHFVRCIQFTGEGETSVG